MDNNSPASNKLNNFEAEDANLMKIINLIIRNKFFIGSISALFFILAFLISCVKKRVWQGQFEIVLDDKTSKISNIQTNPLLQRLVSGTNSGSSMNIKTEVGILESPSVLMPIFDFVKNEKVNSNLRNKKLNFINWKNKNLNIALRSGTSILNISYKDYEKDLILQVLQKISSTYQDYSGKSKRREQELAKNYLKGQIDLFTKKSSNSLKNAQDFAIDQDLIYLDINSKELDKNKSNIRDFNNKSLSAPSLLIPNVSIENIRVAAANDIRRIDLQLEKISNLGDDVEKLQYIGSTIPALVNEGLPQKLKSIEEEIAFLSTKYTKTDKLITRKYKEREILINLLKERTIKYLNVFKMEAEARMGSAMRPKGVLLKYKELIREAERDEKTLVNLENQLSLLELDIAKFSDPWELITKPTILTDPVAPKRKVYALVGLVFGFFTGLFYSIYKERKSGTIYEIEDLKKIFPFPFFPIFPTNNNQTNKDNLNLLGDFFNRLPEKNISILIVGESKEEKKDSLINLLLKSSLSEKKELNIISYNKKLNNLKEFRFLAVDLESATISQLDILRQRLNLFKTKIEGIILI